MQKVGEDEVIPDFMTKASVKEEKINFILDATNQMDGGKGKKKKSEKGWDMRNKTTIQMREEINEQALRGVRILKLSGATKMSKQEITDYQLINKNVDDQIKRARDEKAEEMLNK